MAKRVKHVFKEAFAEVPADLGDVTQTLLKQHFHYDPLSDHLFSAVVGILQTQGLEDPTMGLTHPIERYGVRYAPKFFDGLVAAIAEYGNNQQVYDAVFDQLKLFGRTNSADTTPPKAAAK